MVSDIQAFRDRGLATLAIGAIAIYQRTLSKVTPPRCRFFPSCSQYGIDAIREWGVLEGVLLTRHRISRCRRPNGGRDPVPMRLSHSTRDVSKPNIHDPKFEEVSGRNNSGVIEEYSYSFKLILCYPRNREFISREDLKLKIAEFNRKVLQIHQYALLFKVSKVEVGEINNSYLLRFTGSVCGEYLEHSVDEIVGLLAAQLEGFFLAAQSHEFKALYFEVDGQVIYSPQAKQKTVIPAYAAERDFWLFTSDPIIWDVYWGDFRVDTLSVLLDIASDFSIDMMNVGLGVGEPGDVLSSSELTNPGCDLDINPFDGDGCDLGGCDGCSW